MQVDVQVIPFLRRFRQALQRTRVSGGQPGHFVIGHVMGHKYPGALQKRFQLLPHPHHAVPMIRCAPFFRLNVPVFRVDLVGLAGMGMVQEHPLLPAADRGNRYNLHPEVGR